MPDTVRMPDGSLLVNVHDEGACTGHHCVIHNPSAHHMRSWPLSWCNDRKVFERTCPCGVGHLDPDVAAFLKVAGRSTGHGCCASRCCVDTAIDGEIVVKEIGA